MKSKILQLLMSFVHGAIVIFGREAGVTSFESRGMAFFHCLLELIWERETHVLRVPPQNYQGSTFTKPSLKCASPSQIIKNEKWIAKFIKLYALLDNAFFLFSMVNKKKKKKKEKKKPVWLTVSRNILGHGTRNLFVLFTLTSPQREEISNAVLC